MCRVSLRAAPSAGFPDKTLHITGGAARTPPGARPRATPRNQEDGNPRRPFIPRHALSRRPTAGSEGDETSAAASCLAVGDRRSFGVKEGAEGIEISRIAIGIRNVELWTNDPMRCNDFRAALHITQYSTLIE